MDEHSNFDLRHRPHLPVSVFRVSRSEVGDVRVASEIYF
jgi:hypothetical protein